MENIWGFLLQTFSVSLVAALLILVKYILEDKLSPRWQYAVWGILALRMVIPVSLRRYILLPLPKWIETAKGVIEGTLGSSYSTEYTPISVKHVLPVLRAEPESVTDWLFIVYAAGIAICLLWYAVSYIRLRLLLGKGRPLSAENAERLGKVCGIYGLKKCRAVELEWISSAFVCGVIKPVLVLPAGKETDEKIILHELLHLNHRDALQSALWCVLRSLHWCNPFIHYVINRIENDMEALCDQRVLERLEGEERREYGVILLEMANEKYARAPGTTSVSNGGRNIARRIAAIVRFKKYPRGMALVSVCVIIVMLIPSVWGTANAYTAEDLRPSRISEIDRAMAAARVNRCTTVAGALDTYAKGLMYENGVYLAAASSLDKHADIEAEMRYNAEVDGWVSRHIESGKGLDYLVPGDCYRIFDIVKNTDGSYEAMLVFSVSSFLNEDGVGWVADAEGNAVSGCVIIPITIRHEDAWVVEESGERILSRKEYDQVQYPGSDLKWARQLTVAGETGTVTISERTVYSVDNTVTSSSFGDETPKLSAEFESSNTWSFLEYICAETPDGRYPQKSASVKSVILTGDVDEEYFDEINIDYDTHQSGSSTGGYDWANEPVDSDWDGSVSMGSGGTSYDVEEYGVLPQGYMVQILWDGEVVEEFTLTEEK